MAELEERNRRWRATITYKHSDGPRDVVHEIEEIDELDGLVEHGPAWWTIENIRIVFIGDVPPEAKTRTVEEARRM